MEPNSVDQTTTSRRRQRLLEQNAYRTIWVIELRIQFALLPVWETWMRNLTVNQLGWAEYSEKESICKCLGKRRSTSSGAYISLSRSSRPSIVIISWNIYCDTCEPWHRDSSRSAAIVDCGSPLSRVKRCDAQVWSLPLIIPMPVSRSSWIQAKSHCKLRWVWIDSLFIRRVLTWTRL